MRPKVYAIKTGARAALLLFALLPMVACSHNHTRSSDSSFEPKVEHPAFAAGAGPRVVIDESHCNLHTAGGLYKPLAELLRRDGFVVEPLKARFTAEALAGVDVLVIANALGERNCEKKWDLPTSPAFRSDEVAAVEQWVDGGGSLR
jgi:hypothetical protein